MFFFGQSISLVGTWMQMVAIAWLVYRLSNSAILLGVIMFASQVPAFILTPFTGVIADHFDRRKIIITTQVLEMLQAFVFAFLIYTNAITLWHIAALSIFLGLVSSFEMPARQAFVVDMVENKQDLGNAIALNSSMFNGARLLGPAIAGILIASFGEGICFLLNGISFIAVIFVLIAMRIKNKNARKMKGNFLGVLKEGFDYAFHSAPIRRILFLVTLVSLTGMSYTVLMPVFAKDILKGGPKTLGFLMAASGVGALLGTIYLATRKDSKGLEKVISKSVVIFGAGLMAFSFSRYLWLSMIFMFCTGFGMIVQMASSNTILQYITDEDKRGRVMSLFVMAFIGASPFGSLLAGALANKIGAPHTILISGSLCILGSFLFLRNSSCYER